MPQQEQSSTEWRRSLLFGAGICAILFLLAWVWAERQPAASALPDPVALQSDTARIYYPGNEAPHIALPGGGSYTVRSMLNITKPMHFGDFVWNDANVPVGPVWVRVDLARQIVSVFRSGHEIGTAVILYGAPGKPTPTGLFKILQKAPDYYSHTYDAPMPYMLRLTADGVALHASNVRENYATHGCIGTPMGFARKLYSVMNLGDRVVIVGTPPPSLPQGQS
jgi:hypothetical protein